MGKTTYIHRGLDKVKLWGGGASGGVHYLIQIKDNSVEGRKRRGCVKNRETLNNKDAPRIIDLSCGVGTRERLKRSNVLLPECQQKMSFKQKFLWLAMLRRFALTEGGSMVAPRLQNEITRI